MKRKEIPPKKERKTRKKNKKEKKQHFFSQAGKIFISVRSFLVRVKYCRSQGQYWKKEEKNVISLGFTGFERSDWKREREEPEMKTKKK